MDASTRVKRVYTEAQLQAALFSIAENDSRSIRATAAAYAVPESTLRNRLAGHTSCSSAHEHRQNLSSAEEKTLVRWLSNLTRAGFPASPALLVEMAEEVRRSRFKLGDGPSPQLRPLGKHWSLKFRARHPDIKGVWTRQIERARYDGVNSDALSKWFDAVRAIMDEHQYGPSQIYNMDESGFAVGTSQTSRALVNVRDKTSWKKIQGRQEWITAIEVVDAAGVVGPPLLIFKSKHLSTGWVPDHAPPDWSFTTSKSGWTSDSHGYQWLTEVFEPWSRQRLPDPAARRMLIMDGHSSHVTTRVISFCMQNAIDLLIMPPHCSHVLQPLDVSVFAPLKRALGKETDKVARLDSSRIARVQWTEMYIRAHKTAFSMSNICSGWRATGLYPLYPGVVLDKVGGVRQSTSEGEGDNSRSGEVDLDTSLLDSSPPDGTELRQANAVLMRNINSASDLTPRTKRYTGRIARGFERLHTEMVTMIQERDAQRQLLEARKKRKTGKRVMLQNKFIFSTPEVLKITMEAESLSAKNKRRRGLADGLQTSKVLSDDDQHIDDSDVESEGSVIVVAHTMRS
jgi:hypothetical protein